MVNKVRLKNGTDHLPFLDTIQWLPVRKKPIIEDAWEMPADFKVETLEGTLQGKEGDYLLKGVRGEMYPIKKAIFEETYDIL